MVDAVRVNDLSAMHALCMDDPRMVDAVRVILLPVTGGRRGQL
jgi:hypothetical protein